MLWHNFTTDSKQNRKLYKNRFQLLKSTFVHPNLTYPYSCQIDTKCHQEHRQRKVMDHLKPEGSAEVTEERPFKKESTLNIWRNAPSNNVTISVWITIRNASRLLHKETWHEPHDLHQWSGNECENWLNRFVQQHDSTDSIASCCRDLI